MHYRKYFKEYCYEIFEQFSGLRHTPPHWGVYNDTNWWGKKGVAEFRSSSKLEPPFGNHRLQTLGLLLTLGSFLLMIKLLCLELRLGACLLTIGVFFAARAVLLAVGAFCYQWESRSSRDLNRGPKTHPKSRNTKKRRIHPNFFKKFARTFACFPVTRVRKPREIVQKNLFRWIFLFWVDFLGWIFLL